MTPSEIEAVSTTDRAAVLLHPLRLEVLREAHEPRSATQIAARLGEPRQKVNYHVHQLANGGFLRPAGRRRKRNLTEQLYVATARAYVLAPQILASFELDPERIEDRMSASYLVALASRAQAEVVEGLGRATKEGRRLATLSIDVDLCFASAAQRAAFAEALQKAIADVVARYATAPRDPDGSPTAGRPYRLFASCYPVPASGEAPAEEMTDE